MRKYVRPYMTDAELTAAQSMASAALSTATWPVNYYETPTASIYLAAILGVGDQLEHIVATIPDTTYDGDRWYAYYHHTPQIVLGLGSPEAVLRETNRLKLVLRSPEYITGWLATTETANLDQIVKSIRAIGTKEEAEALVDVFARVVSPIAAPYMLELIRESKAPKPAKEWLDRHPTHAIYGLIPAAVGAGRNAEAATDFLRRQKKLGRIDVITAVLDGQPTQVVDRVRTTVIDYIEREYTPFDASSTPAWLADALSTVVPNKKRMVDVADLPPVVVGDFKLNDEQVKLFVEVLATSTLEHPQPVVAAVKKHTDPLDEFAWELFEKWMTDGAPAKEKWQMASIGLIGGDVSALKLAPLIRKWPGESQHQRAVLGLECLRAIGTDTALMQINGIANKVAFKGIKQRAAECMDDIAKARNMTRTQLEDRIVPDCDLDERGSRIFDFGPRQFRFVLSPEMKAMVKDASAKVSTDLPKPNSKDDAALAEAAVAEWKLLKKQVSEVAKIQAARLEQVMVTGRRWTAAEFDQLLVKHPLMTNLVRMLVWGAYDFDGKLLSTFRVTEDQSLADNSDGAFVVPDGAQVGIPHPLQMTQEDKSAWGEIWADYEIVPPFSQLGRATFAIVDAERGIVEMKRFGDKRLPCATVIFTLEKLGWQRSQPADGGGFNEHTKPFSGANVTAVAQYEPGTWIGGIQDGDPQKIEDVFFVPGIFLPGEMWPEHKKRLTWGDVDPVVVSEVLADLTSIYAKEK